MESLLSLRISWIPADSKFLIRVLRRDDRGFVFHLNVMSTLLLEFYKCLIVYTLSISVSNLSYLLLACTTFSALVYFVDCERDTCSID